MRVSDRPGVGGRRSRGCGLIRKVGSRWFGGPLAADFTALGQKLYGGRGCSKNTDASLVAIASATPTRYTPFLASLCVQLIFFFSLEPLTLRNGSE